MHVRKSAQGTTTFEIYAGNMKLTSREAVEGDTSTEEPNAWLMPGAARKNAQRQGEGRDLPDAGAL